MGSANDWLLVTPVLNLFLHIKGATNKSIQMPMSNVTHEDRKAGGTGWRRNLGSMQYQPVSRGSPFHHLRNFLQTGPSASPCFSVQGTSLPQVYSSEWKKYFCPPSSALSPQAILRTQKSPDQDMQHLVIKSVIPDFVRIKKLCGTWDFVVWRRMCVFYV